MRWSPHSIGPWVARVPADHACAPSQGRMKWNEMDEMSVEKWWNEICGEGKREKPREKPTQTPFRPPRNPHGGTETLPRDPSGGRHASNRLRHLAAFIFRLNIHITLFFSINPHKMKYLFQNNKCKTSPGKWWYIVGRLYHTHAKWCFFNFDHFRNIIEYLNYNIMQNSTLIPYF